MVTTETMHERPQSSLCRWRVSNLLVAGRRVTGETAAVSPEGAVRNVAARNARDLHVDVPAAIAGALRDPLKKVEPLVGWSNQAGSTSRSTSTSTNDGGAR
jgi:hypothetical protein